MHNYLAAFCILCAFAQDSLIELFGLPFETGPVVDDRVHTFIVGGNSINTYHAQESGRFVEVTLALSIDPAESPNDSRNDF
jgi:hypothetical protein